MKPNHDNKQRSPVFYWQNKRNSCCFNPRGKQLKKRKQNVLDALELYLEDMQSEEDNANKILEEDLIIS